MSRYIVIAGIHGRYDEFEHLLDKCADYLRAGYKLVLLGDYLGYGKQSKEVAKKILELADMERVIVLKGHWEDILYRAYRPESIHESEKYKKIIINKRSYLSLFELVDDKKLLEEYLDLIEQMKLYHIDDKYLFAHSGVDFRMWRNCSSFNMFLLNHTESHFLWNNSFYDDYLREYFTDKDFIRKSFPYTVVAGHVPTYKINPAIRNFYEYAPFVWENVIGVDFGASSKHGRLGAVIIRDALSYISVKVGFNEKKWD
ncbi:hypothetical protein CON36_32105 [Bacillus cereus]|uniref:Calcineurin-like phosphoesterase domain-containing protein n=1 Tax=Bacillus cereus TaxID=1396 RepID=A0A9X6STB0_BACCE|nr:metallophosphoesterase [Bacillus cereus]PDZ94765.1 hypothetical protein CON36_32105 [Bacillus cereus]